MVILIINVDHVVDFNIDVNDKNNYDDYNKYPIDYYDMDNSIIISLREDIFNKHINNEVKKGLIRCLKYASGIIAGIGIGLTFFRYIKNRKSS